MTKLEVVFLGTSSATPTKGRNLPAIAIRREGEVVLMDCGEGTQKSFVERGIGINKEMVVLITHLHGDHVNGLLGLLQTMSMSQRGRKLTLVGPGGLYEWVRASMEMLHIGLSFDLEFVEAMPGTILRRDAFVVRCSRASHSVEAFAYVFEETPRPGAFDKAKAEALGVPEGKKWSSLQHGRSVVVGGRRVRPSEVVGPKRPGRRVGYSGDSRPSASLARFFSGVDLLIFDSTFAAGDRDKAVERRHSTCVEAAEVAKRAGARRLALTHFSARYRSVSALLRQAREVFPGAFAASDGMVFEVPPRAQ
ncbi:MAG TPA: ribonuclease Z [Nitrososphaerales archaeon]|nr:ribonuclease Z [Nitrososphaerales archaeon]